MSGWLQMKLTIKIAFLALVLSATIQANNYSVLYPNIYGNFAFYKREPQLRTMFALHGIQTDQKFCIQNLKTIEAPKPTGDFAVSSYLSQPEKVRKAHAGAYGSIPKRQPTHQPPQIGNYSNCQCQILPPQAFYPLPFYYTVLPLQITA